MRILLASSCRSFCKLLVSKRMKHTSISYSKGWLMPFFSYRSSPARDSTCRHLADKSPARLCRTLSLAGAHRVHVQPKNTVLDRSLFQSIALCHCPSPVVHVKTRAASERRQGQPSKTEKPVRRRRRLDEICVERFPEHSRTLIQSWIMQGKVLVEGQPVWKSGASLPESANIRIIAEVPKYVCRAGYKLEGALSHFAFDPSGLVVLDSGLSTGGFTDCLLQNGAVKVYGVDVGYGQVSEKIRVDDRVVVMERTNLRYLEPLPELVDLVTLDLSFISILTVMPAVTATMKRTSSLIALIKPQFEARKGQVGSGGIVRDPKVHSEVLDRVIAGVEGHGFHCRGWTTSPIKGAEGNVEFLAHFLRGPPSHGDGYEDTVVKDNLAAIDDKETKRDVDPPTPP